MLCCFFRVFSSVCIALLLMILGAVSAQATSGVSEGYNALRPGLWEINTSTSMLSMPLDLPPVPYRATQCLTQELLDNQQNLTTISAMRGKCEIHDVDVTTERTQWTMTCLQNGILFDANGAITPTTRESYTGKVNFTMRGDRLSAVKGEVHVQGNWRGECSGAPYENHAQPNYRKPTYTE